MNFRYFVQVEGVIGSKLTETRLVELIRQLEAQGTSLASSDRDMADVHCPAGKFTGVTDMLSFKNRQFRRKFLAGPNIGKFGAESVRKEEATVLLDCIGMALEGQNAGSGSHRAAMERRDIAAAEAACNGAMKQRDESAVVARLL